MKRIFSVLAFMALSLVSAKAFATPSTPQSFGVLSVTPITDILSLENIVIGANGSGTATLYLQTKKSINGTTLFISYDPTKILLSEPVISPKGNALKAMMASNLTANEVVAKLSTDIYKKAVTMLAINGGNVAMLAIIDTDARTGKIPLAEISFIAQPGSSKLYIITKMLMNQSGQAIQPQPQPLEVTIFR